MNKKFRFKEILSVILSVSICVGIYLYARSGSLTPPGAPGSTMFSLSDIAGSGFSSTTHSLAQIKAGIGTNADAAAMDTTLFAGQQYIWDNRASFGTVGGDATAANQTTILGRIGTNADAAAMDTTLFAGQQYLWDNRASFGGSVTMLSAENGAALSIANAVDYCRDLSAVCAAMVDETACPGDTFTDWRLPTVGELSLFMLNPSDNSCLTTRTVEYAVNGAYWVHIELSNGGAEWTPGGTAECQARCVR